jgi:hypothetical protein
MNTEVEGTMEKNRLFPRIFAVAGTVLLLFPILFMLVTGVVGSIQSGQILCDYMLPAELGIVVIVGAAILLVAAILSKKFIKPIAWTIGATIVLIVTCTGLAAASGLASGRVSETDVPGVLAVVIGSLIAYDVAVAVLGVLGIFLTIALFKTDKKTA